MTHFIIQIPGTRVSGTVLRRRRHVPPWCRDTHPLQQSVAAALGAETIFRTFIWSGANGPEARLRAAADLADYIRETRKRHPAARIHLVAHSHGGNVAFYAARDPAVSAELSSIVCLSTPFLHISPCSLGLELVPKLTLVSSLAAIIVLGMLSRRIWQGGVLDFCQHIPASWQILAQSWKPFAQTLIAAGLIFGSVVMTFNHIFEKAHLATYAYAKKFALPCSLPCPTLLIRTPGDEASDLLAAVQLVSGSMTRLLRVLLAPCECPPVGTFKDSVAHWRATACWCRAYFAMAGDWLAHARRMPLTAALRYRPDRRLEVAAYENLGADIKRCAPTKALRMLLFDIAAPLAAALILLAGMLATLFGLRFAIAASMVQISAESTPPGRWLLTQLDSGSRSPQGFATLSHQTHSNPAALQAIGDFLSQKFNAMQCAD